MDVVDAHLHLFKALSDDYPRAIFEGMTPPEREESAERLLEAMDAAGVDRAVYCALSEHDHYLAEVLADHPGKFAGVSVYDFADPDPLDTLQRRIDAGIEGVRFYGLEGEPGADPESLAVFGALAAMRDADMKAWFYGPADQVALLDGCLELLPGLKVVLNHLGFLPNMHLELKVDDHARPQFDMPLPPPGLEALQRLRPLLGPLRLQRRALPVPGPAGDHRPHPRRLRRRQNADGVRLALDPRRARLPRDPRRGRPAPRRHQRPRARDDPRRHRHVPLQLLTRLGRLGLLTSMTITEILRLSSSVRSCTSRCSSSSGVLGRSPLGGVWTLPSPNHSTR